MAFFLWAVIFGQGDAEVIQNSGEQACAEHFLSRDLIFLALIHVPMFPGLSKTGLFVWGFMFFVNPILTVIHLGSLTDLYHMDHFKASFR